MTADNTAWNTINRLAIAARPRPTHMVSLGDWMDMEHRAKLIAWARQAGYQIGIDATDMGEQSDHVRDMETRDMDVLQNGADDYSIWPRQSGGGI